MMTDRPRGVVIPFRQPERRGGHAPRVGPRGAANPAPWFAGLVPDQVVNDAWDRLITQVVQAWCWRDPESLAAVAACIHDLRPSVERDWS